MWLGLSNTPRTVIGRIGDYSYGHYICGYYDPAELHLSAFRFSDVVLGLK
jgi:hypothetical protein